MCCSTFSKKWNKNGRYIYSFNYALVVIDNSFNFFSVQFHWVNIYFFIIASIGYLYFPATGPLLGPWPSICIYWPWPPICVYRPWPPICIYRPWPPICVYRPWLQIFIYRPWSVWSLGLQIPTLSPQSVFTGPGLRFLLPCSEFAFTFLSIVVAVAVVILAIVVTS